MKLYAPPVFGCDLMQPLIENQHSQITNRVSNHLTDVGLACSYFLRQGIYVYITTPPWARLADPPLNDQHN